MLWLALAATVAVTGGTVHPVSGPAIEQGIVVFEDERITLVGAEAAVTIPEGTTIVDATGLHVWPGLIDADARTELGLREISSVRGTMDVRESGQMNPNARAEVAVNASSSHIPVTRANGVLLAATLPSGSMVPGTSAVIALDGWTWEEMVRKAPAALVIRWPAMGPKARGADDEEEEDKGPEWEERIARLDDMIGEAKSYHEGRNGRTPTREPDVRWDSLRSVVEGKTPLWIEASNATQIRSALDWTAKHGLTMTLVDGGDAWRFADELARRGIAVIVKTNRMPLRRYEPYDTPFVAPAKLQAAGVAIAFGTGESSNARNLPNEAARAWAFGLPREAAERAITMEPARALGIADRYGTLEPGKSATLILVDGDLLETRMSVTRAWIDGRELDLSSRHTELWKKWSSRPKPGG
jgi:imidazolonepropionase-like amidohydrolase